MSNKEREFFWMKGKEKFSRFQNKGSLKFAEAHHEDDARANDENGYLHSNHVAELKPHRWGSKLSIFRKSIVPKLIEVLTKICSYMGIFEYEFSHLNQFFNYRSIYDLIIEVIFS